MKSINPHTQELIREYEEDSDEVIHEKLQLAEQVFQTFRRTSFAERSEKMRAVADDLKKNKLEYARTLTLEMGKPITEARAEVEKCAWVCEYYAEKAEDFLRPEPVDTDAGQSYVSYEPLGVIMAVMPWNFPFWQVFRFAAPTIMAGNTAVLKHASNVQGSAFLLEQIFHKAGFDKGVFQNLCISSGRVENILRNPIVKGASVTGSGKAGAAVAEICGSEIKPTLLELGGTNSFIVLADADIGPAAALGVKARMINNAQSCIAAKRFILVKEIAEAFIAAYTEELKALKTGDPMEEDTQVGPLASTEQAQLLEKQLQRSLSAGAELVYGGRRDKAHFQPTVIRNVRPGMPAFDEELFGPVAAMIIAENEDEAIYLSNDTRFGLGVTIVTRDTGKAREMSKEIEDGAVFINELVKSDPRLPFGGTKKSGYGRELSHHGIHAFVNAKTVFIKEKVEGE